MNSVANNKVPWDRIVGALEELLRFEISFDEGDWASPVLLAALVRETNDNRWFRHLKSDGNCARLIRQVIAESRKDRITPKVALEVVKNRYINIGDDGVKAIDAELANSMGRLQNHLRERYGMLDPDETLVYERYGPVLASGDISVMTDLVLLSDALNLRLSVDHVALFLEKLTKDEATWRFQRLGEWFSDIGRRNHDGVLLTALLVEYLTEESDFNAKLEELDRLSVETREGRFYRDNLLQRDLEFHRFEFECMRQLNLQISVHDCYAKFQELPDLGPVEDSVLALDDQHIVEAKRVAYEASVFLKYLESLRAKTTRPIVVVGNDRYGRQWVVEPLEKYLKENFIVHYFRVPSHASMRLRVPNKVGRDMPVGFTREFIKKINEVMPHIVIVDSPSPRGGDHVMKISRATRNCANWIMAFNDVRAEGDESRYASSSALPPHLLGELKKWNEFVVVKRKLQAWVDPGTTYEVAHWSPVLKDIVLMGDYEAPRRDPDLSNDNPTLILSNPAVYENLPDGLSETTPYYFDGPEKHVREEIVYGFGPYGLESRVVGPTTDMLVAAAQKVVRDELERLLET